MFGSSNPLAQTLEALRLDGDGYRIIGCAVAIQ